jgi:hypothetical protein
MELNENAVKLTKESAKYNVEEKSFYAGGNLMKYTFDGEAVDLLSNSAKRLLLIGIRNTVIDSCASLTKKAGFTDEQRLVRMMETMASLNDGKIIEHKAEKAPSVKLSTFADVVGLDEIRLLVKMHVPLNVAQKALLENTLDNAKMEDDEDKQI